MGVIHPAGRAARRLPLPDIGIAGFRVMQSAAAHGGRRVGDRLRPRMKGPAAGQRDIHGGQQHRKLVFVVLMLVAELKAGVKQVPSVGFLDERQMLQRARGVLPGEEEIGVGAVMHRADLDSGFSLAVEISAFAGQERERLDAAPGPIGCVAVEERGVGGIDAAYLHVSTDSRSVATMSEPPVIAAATATTNALACRVGFRDRAGPEPGARRGVRFARPVVARLGARLQRMGRDFGRCAEIFAIPTRAPTARPAYPAVRPHRAAAAAPAAGRDGRCAAVAQRRRSCTGSGRAARQRRGSPTFPPSAASPRRSRSRIRNRAARR